MRCRLIVLVSAVLLVAACGDDGPTSSPSVVEGVTAPVGFAVEIVADGLGGPTQFVVDPAGAIVLAELNGAEGEGVGRVIRIDADDPTDREPLVEGLLTPTGVALDGSLLWIMEQRRLTVGPYADPSDRTVVLDELPYNGRSEGTISAVVGGGILYDTSGRRDGDELVAGSGTLWYLAGPDDVPEPVATGFKHAYAHAPTGDGRWFVTEISDGQLNGGAPPDELVIASDGDDFGYPRCIGDREPVTAFDVTAADCEATPRSHAVLEPRSTPTSVVVAPWADETVLVALWGTGEVVQVPAAPADGPHDPVAFLDGLEHPQHLAADGDRLLVGDFTGGRLLAVSRP